MRIEKQIDGTYIFEDSGKVTKKDRFGNVTVWETREDYHASLEKSELKFNKEDALKKALDSIDRQFKK